MVVTKKFLTVKCSHFGADLNKVIKLGRYHLLPLNGSAGNFHEQVRKLTRPYMPITNKHFESLEKLSFDFYLTKSGKVVTYGHADNGFALMPLNQREAIDILAKNNIFF